MLVYSLINTKKSALGNPGRAGGGGLRRNSDGNWVPGFSRGLGCTNSCLAELWALRDGLNLASDIGIENLIFEIDAFFFFFFGSAESMLNFEKEKWDFKKLYIKTKAKN